MEVWIVMTCGDIFSGGGGWSLGAIAAGLEPIWAIESDPQIAETYAANVGSHVIVEQAQSVDIRRLDAPDVLLCSPPCQSHSNARSKRLAARDDAEVGLCVLDYVRYLRPRFVVIENVEGWKRSHSFKAIFHGLHEMNYWCDVQVLNAADFGVCQTRRRLILRASREGMLPALPPPVVWRGWYRAIKDLIDGLPESRFADWQLKRIDPAIRDFLAVVQGASSDIRESSEPPPTITSAHGAAKYRAFIVRSSDQCENCDIARPQQDPIWTLTEGNTAHGRVKAFIVPGGNANSFSVRMADEPTRTIEDVNRVGNRPRAWLDSGRVVAMSPRALARFQSFPDSYELPTKAALACRIIGNAIPCLFAQRLLEGLV